MNKRVQEVFLQPRPMRILFGGLMATAGLMIGGFFGVDLVHQSVVSSLQPEPIRYVDLVQQLGSQDDDAIQSLTQQPMVLHGVSYLDPVQRVIDREFNKDDEHIAELRKNQWLQLRRFWEEGITQVDLSPVDGKENPNGTLLRLSANPVHVKLANDQLAADGALTGVIRRYGPDEFFGDVVTYQRAGRLEFGPKQVQEVPAWTFVPVSSESRAEIGLVMFLLGGLLLAAGTAICASGGPNLFAWILTAPFALLSLVGYPLRYGRGTQLTRLAYIGASALLCVGGVGALLVLGSFGKASGVWSFQLLGFTMIFAGLAASIGAIAQKFAHNPLAAVELAYTPEYSSIDDIPRWDRAAVPEKGTEPKAREYRDDPLMAVASIPLTGKLKEQAWKLSGIGFSEAGSLQWQREEYLASASIQLGCQNVVVSEMEYDSANDQVSWQLISVLSSGKTIISLSDNFREPCTGNSDEALIQQIPAQDSAAMLTKHLERVVSEAEQQNATTVEFNLQEIRNVAHLSHRIMAGVRGTSGGKPVRVSAKSYGRFDYPPQPINTPVVAPVAPGAPMSTPANSAL
ncbi:MAG: hypothetical protein CBB71_00680 [Rhodopirellula sp. TMED11]|nr:MAG: hypothetical protein CBB71_00680 [Rhodopirellula sp. TMED11]